MSHYMVKTEIKLRMRPRIVCDVIFRLEFKKGTEHQIKTSIIESAEPIHSPYRTQIFVTRILLRPANEVWSKVMFSQASVILSTWGESVSRRGLHPEGRSESWGRAGQTPSPRILQNMVKEQAVRILLECILVSK